MGLPWGCGHPSLTGHARDLLTSLVTLLLLRLGSGRILRGCWGLSPLGLADVLLWGRGVAVGKRGPEPKACPPLSFTFLLVLSHNTGLNVVGPGQPLTATVGQDVVLPCHLSPQHDARSLDIRWIRDHISETVHHYRNGQDLYGEQMGAYSGRTELVRDGLSAGSLQLRITGLRPSDDGLYVCNVKNADSYAEAIVELEVSGADPHLSLGDYEAGGVRVLCRSAGWYPLPQLLWRDARGQHLPSDPPTHSQDQEGLFEIEGAVIVTGSVEGPLSLVYVREGLVWVGSGVLCAEGIRSLWFVAVIVEKLTPLINLGKACPGLSSAPDGLAPSVPAVKVTLDPDTAHPLLVVSQDNKSVRRESEPQQVPDTPERFDSWCCVLGREEFREGRHCWLVEVEGEQIKDSWWAMGVARASVERKGWINASPKEGIWAVRYYEGQLMSLTWPPTHLSLSPIPTRIWVCLDCTQQQVSFINADNGVEIFTFTAASFNGESIRPWFWLVSNSLQLFLRDSTPQTLLWGLFIPSSGAHLCKMQQQDCGK
uniref:Butyrophilin subfamily 1 member A1 n=1 Tax=Anas platyrhynchos TaxID=8839 RepID=A0A8B9SVH4_ANAPL